MPQEQVAVVNLHGGDGYYHNSMTTPLLPPRTRQSVVVKVRAAK